jgi:hypothetical protein
MAAKNLRIAALGAVAALAMTTALTGCSSEVPQVKEPEAQSIPALGATQTTNALDAMMAALDAATQGRDPALLAGRVSGPALEVRTSQLQVAAVRDNNDLITVIPPTFQRTIVPTATTWPRATFAITDPTEDLEPPRMLALVQNSARENYQLWSWVQLQPGVVLPATADPAIGSEEVAPDDASLLVSPQDAVSQYADLLTAGDASAFVGNFQPKDEDQFRSFIAMWNAEQVGALSDDRVEGTVTLTVTPKEGAPIFSVRTADGGAITMFALTMTEQLEAMEGAVLRPSTPTAQALLSGVEPTNRLRSGFIDMVALHIPPAGSSAQITLLGYSHVQVLAAID